jgi:hypothetical protein
MVDALDGVKSDSVEQKVETAAIVQQSILNNRKKTRELTRESIELVEPYLDELNALFKDRETTYETYNKALLANFLGSPRRVVKLKDKSSSVDFTIQDINDLSQFMVVRLYQDYLWQDITQWQNPEPEKLEEKPESEPTEDNEKNE